MSPEDLAFLDGLLRARSGFALPMARDYFAESRLAPLARREGFDTVEALVARLRAGGDLVLATAASEALSVTDTAFFRDGAVFQALSGRILPALAAGARPGQAVQAWCAGCSTGQEAYSLAMLAEDAQVPTPLDIVATDLSERVLEKAHSGLYTQFEVQRGLPIRLLLRHFDKAGEMWSVKPKLKARVRWRRLNLIEARRSLRAFDLILCRHILAGFEADVRAQVLASLVAALAPGGWLVLGPDDAGPEGLVADDAPGVFRAPLALTEAEDADAAAA